MIVRTWCGSEVDIRWYEIGRWYRWWLGYVRYALRDRD